MGWKCRRTWVQQVGRAVKVLQPACHVCRPYEQGVVVFVGRPRGAAAARTPDVWRATYSDLHFPWRH